MVLYQAFDDDLRVVYSQIIHQLKFIQFRDKDAQVLLKTRDWKLIISTFDKFITKINLELFGLKKEILKCHTYRKYNQAFFEEILIDYQVEQRVAQNYRERFLISAEDIFLVLEMYSKQDYVNHFLQMDLTQIKRAQFIELFKLCIQYDSFKIATQIYLRFLDASDITP